MITLTLETEPIAPCVTCTAEKLIVDLADSPSLSVSLEGYPRLLHAKEILPFDLGGYIPDLLCKNKEENILIEVKGKVINRKLLDSHYDDRNDDTP